MDVNADVDMDEKTSAVSDAGLEPSSRVPRWAIGLPVLRIALVAAASALAWLIVSAFESGVPFPPSPMLAAVAMLPVNVACLMIVARILRREGRSIRDLLGFQPRRILTDLLWGLLWLVVMFLPFAGAIMFVVWVQHGSEMFIQMQTVFFDPASVPTLTPMVWIVLAIIAAVTFAPLNAPAEELVYRGYSQGALRQSQGPGTRWRTVVAVVVPAALFALQHIWYAPTPDAVVAFVCAFFVWGLCSGLIYLRQRRLMPLVFAHGLVNLFFTLPALAMPYFLSVNGA